jgi:hypothetical protein
VLVCFSLYSLGEELVPAEAILQRSIGMADTYGCAALADELLLRVGLSEDEERLFHGLDKRCHKRREKLGAVGNDGRVIREAKQILDHEL